MIFSIAFGLGYFSFILAIGLGTICILLAFNIAVIHKLIFKKLLQCVIYDLLPWTSLTWH